MSPTLGRACGALLSALALLGPCAPPVAADEKGSLASIEAEFKAAIKRVTPATVVCRAQGASQEQPGSSGVIVSRKGLVLSDGDAAAVLKLVSEGDQRRVERTEATQVEVRVPDVRTGTFKAYTAKVLKRDADADSTLLRIVDPPPGGFPAWVPMGSSDELRVGDFTFAMGNSFFLSTEGTPSLTGGVVGALVAYPEGHAAGRHELIYTTAAVNPGVNGGPLVDAEGNLVATISSFALPTKDDPFQFLGRAIPVQRLRLLYGALPEGQELFPELKPVKARSLQAAALETAYHAASQAAAPWVASLLVERSAPFERIDITNRGAPGAVVRYEGPVSAVLVDADGTLVTSLYNLTNVLTLLSPPGVGDAVTPVHTLEHGLAAITKITVCLSDGRTLPARVVGMHPRAALAVLQAELPAGGYALPAPTPAPADDVREGRFALALGNPYGDKPHGSPLLAVGVLSKRHSSNASEAWRGWWQTDAGVTDANCGGALVDLRGRLLGVLHLWSPLQHGRASGIGFVLPWAEVLEAVAQVEAGRVPRRGYLGAAFKDEPGTVLVASLVDAAPGAQAGLKAGDRLLALDDLPLQTSADLIGKLRFRWEGERARLTVARDGEKKPLTLEVVLGARP